MAYLVRLSCSQLRTMWAIAFTLLVLHARAIQCYEHVLTGCWPYNVIPYKVFRGFTNRQIFYIHTWIGEVNRFTCVRWVNAVNYQLNVTDYVSIKKAKSRTVCRTVKGLLPNGESGITIELGEVCVTREVVMHEMLHVLGFPHEQQRADRDCYVTIDYEKVRNIGQDGRFAITHIPWLESFPYDKSSIMHYPRSTLMKARTERWYNDEPFGNPEGEWSVLDLWKVMYKFCSFPHYCDVFPEACLFTSELEISCAQQQDL